MLRYAIIGSGSKANSYIFQYNDFSFVVDNGFSLREFKRRLSSLLYDFSNIKFVFLTHKHSDHFKGVEKLCTENSIPLVHHEDLLFDFKNHVKKLTIKPGETYDHGLLHFRAFSTYHDSDSSLSYFFKFKDTTFTIITDTGIVSKEMFDAAIKSDFIFIEANYCEKMLDEGPYPEYIKRRIKSNVGHLSNTDTVDFLEKVFKKSKKLKYAYLCHLSDNNNSPDTIKKELDKSSLDLSKIIICPKNEMIEGFSIN